MTKQQGNPEEEYFYKLNQELLDKKRKELDQARSEQQKTERKAAHWMKCPKCGAEMKEIELSGLKIDQCSDCQGVFFDFGELDLLMASKEPGTFVGRLKKLLK